MMSVRPARLLALALLGACLITSAAWARSPAKQAGTAASSGASSLVWRGDVTTARAVATEVAKAWQKAGHGRVEVQSFNTASGLDAVASGSADIAGSARAGNGSAAESRLTFTPVGWDGLVMITHPANPVSSLTLQQLHDIYYGKLTHWNELGGASAPINVYAVASPGDGVEFSLRRLLFGRGNQPVAAPRLYVNTAKLEEAVALDPKALGVTTLAGISGNHKVKALRIDGTAPTLASVASGSYKLFTPLYLVTNPSSPHAAQAQAFVDFAGTDAAKAALRKHAVLPYQDGIALASMDSARRTQILAAVGARAVREPAAAPAIAAPGATYASRAAVAPTSPRTLEAKQALEQRRSQREPAPAEVVTRTASLKGVQGEAITVDDAAARGKDFAKVSGSAHVSATKAAPAATYTVAKGDTLSSIARAHAVTVSDLRAWNRLKGDQVKPGQVLHLRAH